MSLKSFPQSSRGISLVDQIQRLFHPNPLPCLFYLMDSSTVIIQIHALPLQHRHSPATRAYFSNNNWAYSFPSSFLYIYIYIYNILESQKFFQLSFFSVRKAKRTMDGCSDWQHRSKSGRRSEERSSGGRAQLEYQG